MDWKFVGQLRDCGLALGSSGELGRVHTEEFATPPVPCCALFFAAGEPVLPEHGAYISRRRMGERVASEEGQDVVVVFEEALFSEGHDLILTPIAK